MKKTIMVMAVVVMMMSLTGCRHAEEIVDTIPAAGSYEVPATNEGLVISEVGESDVQRYTAVPLNGGSDSKNSAVVDEQGRLTAVPLH